ncbi:putative lipoprotein [[Actinomadura] parvosata subsp. kistnae]|uniref:DUF305 domain-containing protein n=1 Tax=[Actinomadura] parvosata subsp. kistnae TaxID=1909395 RepID=A0A1V0A8W6_9ACTN|nr:DUF305 domain-containing protein [Nonomuraea sp. ATCC 55076]AQZ66592.1 DUF305 domain-containing protein [Nonomuraea sp. ATCC 55076]SPL95328.1 putative lipoprotein [Actinomadura parvosata subsp. kistnae]
MRAAPVVVVALAVALSGCSPDPAPQTPQAGSSAPVIAPGRPGEQARTLSPAEAATAVPSATANAADVTYVQNMIVHHRQAVDMALLAPNRAESPQLQSLADRIQDVQGPEIQFMTTWLREQEQTVPAHHARHDGMPGMATPEQLEALKAAKGKEFDRMFLQLMINHHLGAIEMSKQVLTGGAHIRIEELATDVSVEQAAEIRRMQAMQSTQSTS